MTKVMSFIILRFLIIFTIVFMIVGFLCIGLFPDKDLLRPFELCIALLGSAIMALIGYFIGRGKIAD